MGWLIVAMRQLVIRLVIESRNTYSQNKYYDKEEPRMSLQLLLEGIRFAEQHFVVMELIDKVGLRPCNPFVEVK